ncbi:hypothetical protein AZE42_07382 [Rhizopogon vesiculosus]|uniref:F-box domain-containing protein n=1 Tax=Rhizopogon vesiculosus TaxID=180088 RepID=A0A1J8QJ61_9AGAM|nr:hypothetical protein AZE42_07382 [Rhizopogon vesiculosus]
MNHTARFPFVNLPIELVMLILRFAAHPNFAPYTGRRRINPYSSALAFCHVSKVVRRAVLPEMLETVMLTEEDHVIEFLHALRMQKEYSQQGHRLSFDYIPHIYRIWVGGICEPRRWAFPDPIMNCLPTKPEIDFSILAPVLLSAPSLALNDDNLYLLEGCVKVALHGAFDTDIWHGRDQPLWRTTVITLLGFINPFHLEEYISDGSAFFTSLSRVVFAPPVISDDSNSMFAGPLNIPWWMSEFLQSTILQAISVPRSFVKFPDIKEPEVSGMRVDIVTVPTPAALDDSVSLSDDLPGQAIDAKQEESHKIMDPRSGEGIVWRVEYRPICGYSLWVNWEEAWIHGDGVWSVDPSDAGRRIRVVADA